MPSMSYCLFENTANDLERAKDTLEGLFDTSENKLSERELAKAKELVHLCYSTLMLFADKYIPDMGDMDYDEEINDLTDTEQFFMMLANDNTNILDDMIDQAQEKCE